MIPTQAHEITFSVTMDTITGPHTRWAIPAVRLGVQDAVSRFRLPPTGRWQAALEAEDEYFWIIRLTTKGRTDAVVVTSSLEYPRDLRRRVVEAIRDSDPEDKCLELFEQRLSQLDGRPVRVVARPERDGTHLGRGDAILDRGGHLLATEHTTVELPPGRAGPPCAV